MQISGWQYLSSSPWGIPLHCDLPWKIIDSKNFLFIGTNNWILLPVWWSMKYFFALNSLKSRLRMAQKQEEGEEQEHSNYKALCVMQKQ